MLAPEPGADDDTFAWPGGESYGDLCSDHGGTEGNRENHQGERVAIVTHARVISQVLGVIRSRPAAAWEPDRPLPLTAIEIAWQDGGPSAVLSYNSPHWY
jgi:broad specificity phosphatase PhoE